MILLSRVIKSPFARTVSNHAKTIEIKQVIHHKESYSNEIEEQQNNIVETVDTEAMIQEAKLEAEAIVQRALDEANAIREQISQEKLNAEEEMQLLKEQAKQEGYQEGFHQGETNALTQYEAIIEEAKSIVELAKQDYLTTIEKAEPVIIDLAMAVCQKIIGNVIDENDEAWNIVVKKVIEEVREHDDVKLYVHPNYYERTLAQKDELLSILNQSQELYIYPSATQDEHTCIIETPFGRIDATISSQLEEVKQQLHEKLREELNESS